MITMKSIEHKLLISQINQIYNALTLRDIYALPLLNLE